MSAARAEAEARGRGRRRAAPAAPHRSGRARGVLPAPRGRPWRRSWPVGSRDADAVADVVSNTFLAAIRGAAGFDPGRSPDSARFWLFGIARREIANHHGSAGRQDALARRERGRRQLSDDETARIDELIDAQRLAPEIQAALDELSPSVREAFLLVAVDGVPQAAAAGVLGISHVALRARLTRARLHLRRRLQGPAPQPPVRSHPARDIARSRRHPWSLTAGSSARSTTELLADLKQAQAVPLEPDDLGLVRAGRPGSTSSRSPGRRGRHGRVRRCSWSVAGSVIVRSSGGGGSGDTDVLPSPDQDRSVAEQQVLAALGQTTAVGTMHIDYRMSESFGPEPPKSQCYQASGERPVVVIALDRGAARTPSDQAGRRRARPAALRAPGRRSAPRA